MVFQGLNRQEADNVWRPFLDWVAGSPQDFVFETPVGIVDIPARHLWDANYLRKNVPDAVVADDRPGAPEGNVLWAGDHGQVGFAKGSQTDDTPSREDDSKPLPGKDLRH